MKNSRGLFGMTVPALSRIWLSASLIFLFSAFAYGAFQINLDGPAGSGEFGRHVVVLTNGNLVVIDPGYDAPGPILDVGAAYLYHGATGELISTLTGSATGDFTGTVVTPLPTGDFVLVNQFWDNGVAVDAGAVTHCDGQIGCTGQISPANSLVGSTANDNVGGGLIPTILANGNYVVSSPRWSNGPLSRVGAVTWVNGESETAGSVSASNSLIGTLAFEQLGSPIPTALPNGNYLVKKTGWNNGRGAVTVGNGNGGSIGPLTSANSLVGSNGGDSVGSEFLILPNSNFVIMSPNWNEQRGAVTLCFGDGSTVGEVSGANSIVGSNSGDAVGSGRGIALANSNYAFRSTFWNGERGAVTWGSGTVPTIGIVSDANSLVGTALGDRVGSRGIFPLANGNYVVNSEEWDNGSIANAGAVTWGNGSTGTVGIVTPANSLVGTSENDQVGARDTVPLTNGNYVVHSPFWDNGAAIDAGAVAWGNGNGGTVGPVSAVNALIGTSSNDTVGTGSNDAVAALANGNYVIPSPGWDDTVNSRDDAGAVTWGNGLGGTVGPITAANSVIGSTGNDNVGTGSIYPLTNGNYVFASPLWDNGATADVGAVTFVNGTTGLTGNISPGNSLIGDAAGLRVGTTDTFVLANGNYVVRSTRWNNFTGAIAFGNGTVGTVGVIGPANSLVGSSPDDLIGGSGIFILPNGNYVVSSNSWNNDRGAVTWGNGQTGTIGTVSSANSLTGAVTGDNVGPSQLAASPDGNYTAVAEFVNGGLGGFSFGAGNGPTAGTIGSGNTVFKSAPDAFPPLSRAHANHIFGNMVVGLPLENRVVIFNPTYSAVADGNWSNGLTWNYGEIRTKVDTRIPTGRNVTLDTDVISNLVTVETGASLNVSGQRTSQSSISVFGTIDLSLGGLDMLTNRLGIACDGILNGSGPSNYVIGETGKSFCGPETFRFPSGTANGFSPVDVNVTAVDSGIGVLTVSATQEVHPRLHPGGSLKRYWTLTESNEITADLVFNYLDPIDISNFESTYKPFRIAGGMPELVQPFVLDADANTMSVTGVTEFSDWAIGNLAPTSASVSVAGRVLNQYGRPISNAMVSMSDMNGSIRYARTSSFGYFKFTNIPAGETFIVSVTAKGYRFTPQVITPADDLSGLNFTAEPNSVPRRTTTPAASRQVSR